MFCKLLSLSAGVLLAFSASAHHGFGSFDLDAEVELSGTVTGLDWVNPHAWLYMDVAGPDGEVVPYRCEMRAATVLRRSGWSPDMFPLGERVTISGAPDRDDPNSCYVSTVIFPDGRTIDRYGQRTQPDPVEDRSEREPRLANGDPNISGDWAPEQYVLSDPRGRGGSLVPLSATAWSASDDADGEEAEGNPWAAANVELTELGEEAAADFDPRSSENPRMRCEPTSVVYDWYVGGPINRITQHEDRIVLRYGRYGFTRTIHMDRDEHPADLEPSRSGHSIGRWEGDTLVVETVGFAPGILAPPVFHGEKLRVVERFTVDTEDWTLMRDYEATDPDYFNGKYEGSDTLEVADVPYAPDECKELTFVDYDGQAEADGTSDRRAEDGADGSPWWRFWD